MKSKVGGKPSKTPKEQESFVPKDIPSIEAKSLSSYTDRFFASYSWEVTRNSVCDAVDVRSYSNCSIQVNGPMRFPITITGSNDGVTFYTITRDNKSPLVIHSPGIYSIFENVRFIKPDISDNTECSINLFATV
tara:strand:- start:3 stop:404 length:402 start_codon:yes stop_codon:yes gene_type:complete